MISALRQTAANVAEIYDLILSTRAMATVAACIATMFLAGIWLELFTLRRALESNKPGPIQTIAVWIFHNPAFRFAVKTIAAPFFVVGYILLWPIRSLLKRRMNDDGNQRHP